MTCFKGGYYRNIALRLRILSGYSVLHLILIEISVSFVHSYCDAFCFVSGAVMINIFEDNFRGFVSNQWSLLYTNCEVKTEVPSDDGSS